MADKGRVSFWHAELNWRMSTCEDLGSRQWGEGQNPSLESLWLILEVKRRMFVVPLPCCLVAQYPERSTKCFHPCWKKECLIARHSSEFQGFAAEHLQDWIQDSQLTRVTLDKTLASIRCGQWHLDDNLALELRQSIQCAQRIADTQRCYIRYKFLCCFF